MAFVDGKTSAIIYTLIELIVLAFTVIGTPIDQFRLKNRSYYTGGYWGGGAWTGSGNGWQNPGVVTACQNAHTNNVNACTNSQTNCISGCNSAYAGNADDISNCTTNCSNIHNNCVTAQNNWYNLCVAGGYNTNQLNKCANDYQNAVNACTSGNAITCNNNAWSNYQSCIDKWTLHSASHAGGWTKVCMTMWGFKLDCFSTKYNARKAYAFGCGQRKNNMTGAAVFSIVSIVAILVAFLYGVMMLLGCCRGYLLPAILCLFSVATLLVCWACVAGVYNNKMCSSCTSSATCWGEGKLKNLGWKYGAGFILIIIAWCLQVINCIFVFILMFL